jgi:hypothetical protein
MRRLVKGFLDFGGGFFAATAQTILDSAPVRLSGFKLAQALHFRQTAL